MSKTVSWDDLKKKLDIPEEVLAEARAEIHASIASYNLKEMRRQLEVTQIELAKQLAVSQGMVSKIERGDIHQSQISTLQKYVEALGGKLRISAEFGDKAYLLS